MRLMRAVVFFYEVSFTSIFVGKVTRTFATKEERDECTDRDITPYSLGSDPAVYGIRYSQGRIFVSEEEAEEWEKDGFSVLYPEYE